MPHPVRKPHPIPLELSLQAFPQRLEPETLDDIANTYEGLWEAIQAAHGSGTCTSKFVRVEVDRLRELAVRVDSRLTADAIRAEADLFDQMARRAARSPNCAAARYIRTQCNRRFAAAVIIANYRRGG